MAEAGTLRLDLRVFKSQNPIFFLRIPFYTVQSYHNYKNPVGRMDTLRRPCTGESAFCLNQAGSVYLENTSDLWDVRGDPRGISHGIPLERAALLMISRFALQQEHGYDLTVSTMIMKQQNVNNCHERHQQKK